MPHQRRIAEVAGEINPATGELAYSTVIVLLQRQGGKTGSIGPLGVHTALTGYDRTIWYTAQSRQDARDNWSDVVTLVRRCPLGNVVKGRESQGSEGITFPTGSAYRIFSPVPDALHGKANKLVVIDEGWAFSELLGDELIQAIMSTFSTVDGQLWIISAAGDHHSAWLRSYVESGRAVVESGRTDTIAYFEYGIADDVDPSDLAAIAAAHPACGHTLRPAALAAAAATMKPGEFARAYGNRWTCVTERVIAELIWRTAQAIREPGIPLPQPEPGRVALAIEAGMDQADASIVAVWRDPLGKARCELLDTRPGTTWVRDRTIELAGRWDPVGIGHDSQGPVGHVADELTRTRLTDLLRPTTTSHYAAACAGFLTGLAGGSIIIHTHDAFDKAAAAAAKRYIQDGAWLWSRRASGATIAPIGAATIGVWTYDHNPLRQRFTIR